MIEVVYLSTKNELKKKHIINNTFHMDESPSLSLSTGAFALETRGETSLHARANMKWLLRQAHNLERKDKHKDKKSGLG